VKENRNKLPGDDVRSEGDRCRKESAVMEWLHAAMDNPKPQPGIDKSIPQDVLWSREIKPFVQGGTWTKVSELKEGDLIAVADSLLLGISPLLYKEGTKGSSNHPNGHAIFERITKIELLPPEQVWDVEIANTHNFVGNDIIAHNTYITGNLGIGTSNPGQVLDVNGTIRTTTTGGVTFGTDGKATIQPSATTTPDIKFLTNSSEIMRITNGGNVGIGTTSPTQPLSIERSGANAANMSFNHTGTAAANQIVYMENGVNTAEIDQFGSTHASTGRRNNLEIDNETSTGSVSFGTNSIIDRMVLNSAGNVGIGSTAPGQILDVKTSAGNGVRMVGIGTTVPQQLCITNGKIGYFDGAWNSTCTTP